jgi:L-arabinokinase
VECDTGVVQIDSLRLDERATVARARRFMARLPDLVGTEAAALRAIDARLVVSDVPALGIAAARAAGLPAVALSNFTWDWVYAAYEGAEDVVSQVAEIYAASDVALRLPMWGGFASFPRIIDLPFIARRSRRDPREVRRHFGLPEHERLVLSSFGGYGVDGLDLDAISRLSGYRVIVSAGMPGSAARAPAGPAASTDTQAGRTTATEGGLIRLDEPTLYRGGYRYEDLVRAVDVVVTKPGYGIIAECLANDTALVYTSRGHFVEYDVLVKAMPALLRCAFISQDDLFAGRWVDALDAALAQPAPPERPATNGAEVAAALVMNLIE